MLLKPYSMCRLHAMFSFSKALLRLVRCHFEYSVLQLAEKLAEKGEHLGWHFGRELAEQGMVKGVAEHQMVMVAMGIQQIDQKDCFQKKNVGCFWEAAMTANLKTGLKRNNHN